MIITAPLGIASFAKPSGGAVVHPRAIAVRGETVYVADRGAGNVIWALPAAGGARPRLVRAGPPLVDIAALAFAPDGSLLVADTGYSHDVFERVVAGPPSIWRFDLGGAAGP